MWATDSRRAARRPSTAQSGTAAVEFALLALIFFTLVFGIVELSRLLYVMNTLQEVTRRAAAAAVNVFPRDADDIVAIKRHAVFRNDAGQLLLAPPVTDENVRFDYLGWDLAVIPAGSWPTNAAHNRQICMINPHAANCIRFVEARICKSADGGSCEPVKSHMLLPVIDLRVPLPTAPTIALIETLGYVDGTAPPPPCGC